MLSHRTTEIGGSGIAETVRALLEEVGVADYGVLPFSAVAHRLLPGRAGARLPPDAATVMVAVFPYRFPTETSVSEGRNLAQFACVEDYHNAVGDVLKQAADALRAAFPGRAFVPFVDNSPVPEVTAACLAGLGVRGDHGLLIHPVYGSFVVLGEMVTDLPPEALADTSRAPVGGETLSTCAHCGACRAACPSGVLDAPADKARRCLSAVSQRRGALTAAEARLLRENGLVWGCDTCQEVCPHNRTAVIRPHPCFTGFRSRLTATGPEALAGRAYAWRGQAVLQRNLLVVEGR